jgi:hypothetical protein
VSLWVALHQNDCSGVRGLEAYWASWLAGRSREGVLCVRLCLCFGKGVYCVLLLLMYHKPVRGSLMGLLTALQGARRVPSPG